MAQRFSPTSKAHSARGITARALTLCTQNIPRMQPILNACENLIYAGRYRGTIQKKQLTLYLDERRSHRRALHRINSFIMKRIIILQTLVAVFLLTGQAHAQAALPTDRIVATHYVKADGKTDVTEALQHLIDTHPNRTIYFPDGVYLLSHSLYTPADPTKSVMLVLDNYARLQASPHWQGGAVVRLGGEHPANNITIPGSNYGLRGGIIDGATAGEHRGQRQCELHRPAGGRLRQHLHQHAHCLGAYGRLGEDGWQLPA